MYDFVGALWDRLRCRLGYHDWVVLSTRNGRWVEPCPVCTRCQRVRQ